MTEKFIYGCSHLSVASFSGMLLKAAKFHPIASHSNVLSLCGHVRNLNDDQIKAMVDRECNDSYRI